MKCVVCSSKFTCRIFPPPSWIKLRRRDSRVTRSALGRHSSTLISEMGFSSAELAARPTAPNLHGRQALWRRGQRRVWSCAFLLLLPFYRAQESLKEELWLLFPKRQGVGITAHTRLRMTWRELGQNCPWTWLGVWLELDVPALYFALLQPFLSTRATREIRWRSYLPRGTTRMNAQSSQSISKKTA